MASKLVRGLAPYTSRVAGDHIRKDRSTETSVGLTSSGSKEV